MSIANTQAETIIEAGIIDDTDQTRARVEHLQALEAIVGNSYPNKFERSRITGAEDTISNILHFAPVTEIVRELKDNTPTGERPNQELKESLNQKLKAFGSARVSGRLAVPPRVMGKAAFVHLSDGKERLQIYVRRDDAKGVYNGVKSEPSAAADGLNANNSNARENLPAAADSSDLNGWEIFKLLDHGDFVGVEGYLFLTNTGELSVHVETLQFLSKSLLPMPDKLHGIADPELRRRYRYADLIASSLQVEHEGLTTREVFERRARLISGMRNYLDSHGYIEVETPMLTPKATGAAAEPFETYHKALGIPLYARIAPELYLKRLVVGGFEKVYELNRNFRNEGLSHKHSPEFTMLEFYCAYMDVNGMMDFAEEMIKESVRKVTGGSLVINYDGNEIDFSKFERISMKEAINKFWADEWRVLGGETIDLSTFDKPRMVRRLVDFKKSLHSFIPVGEENLTVRGSLEERWKAAVEEDEAMPEPDESEHGRNIEVLFEEFEYRLIQPTFITDYPKSISPLSKASPENPNIAERFELFISGAERANGFSELNDPQEQFERFVDQMKEREGGDAEAMLLDEDYIRALSYGMPPAAGIGIGIDRLTMLLTNKHSIRDVILFPHMRPERKDEETRKEGEEETGS
ncbi:MAG TPA: lysine--tRNA ligase [Pyrinomonadaceae bacterium]